MDMASGKRVKKIFYRTLQDAFTYDALDHIGCTSIDDMDHVADLLKFHSHLLLRHIGCVHDTDTYHRAMPWKCILCLNPGMVARIMEEMQSLWTFITSCIDTCDEKSAVYKQMVWTRSQPFRECFVVAEFLLHASA